jgi:maltose-binding protein MalE
MPSYTFKNLHTNEEFTAIMSMNEREEFVANNPHMQQVIHSAPALGDSIRLGRQKPPDSFRDVLREIKKKHSKGITKSTINTW